MRYLSLCALLLVGAGAGACHENRPPAPSPEQNQQLNEAEDMLNAMANEEGPADRSTGPSNQSN
ncbi:MAG: hypothetical protein ACJ8FO_04545 [Sphingomicrobium sp.]